MAKYGADKLDHLIAIAAIDVEKEYAEQFKRASSLAIPTDKEYFNGIDRIIKRYNNKEKFAKARRIIWRVAICAMLIMSLCFITVMAVKPLREAVFDTIVEWYENYFEIRYEATDNNSEYSSDNTKKSPPDSIEEIREPTYLPDGVEEKILAQNQTCVYIDYYLADELAFSFNQYLMKDQEKYVDNNTSNVDVININGYVASIISKDDDKGKNIIWSDGEYIYQLYSYIYTIDEMIYIAESINK